LENDRYQSQEALLSKIEMFKNEALADSMKATLKIMALYPEYLWAELKSGVEEANKILNDSSPIGNLEIEKLSNIFKGFFHQADHSLINELWAIANIPNKDKKIFETYAALAKVYSAPASSTQTPLTHLRNANLGQSPAAEVDNELMVKVKNIFNGGL